MSPISGQSIRPNNLVRMIAWYRTALRSRGLLGAAARLTCLDNNLKSDLRIIALNVDGVTLRTCIVKFNS